MPGAQSVIQYTCARCLRRQSEPLRRHRRHGNLYRAFSSTLPPREQQSAAQQVNVDDEQNEQEKQSEGTRAMSRRLADMTDETLGSGGRTARKVVEEAGFSEELKKRLEARIQDKTFRSENPAAFAQINMPVSIVGLASKAPSLTEHSPAPVEAPSRSPQPNHGRALKPPRTLPYECSPTPISPCAGPPGSLNREHQP